ncbi:hypothetical protein AUK40_04120 [Candidatus Wirthbacteria bacterium CG2_30_54_11]|uniref:Large ribosomal subunit protein bL35 n=1 Tax=Candidatus Wirthbacteria bacterium CG2_30_54_11 TaxID=1817892 RepID=A0A1J5IIZ2_9BACT|nr:MAG: hypothetical protein AUK40_04120 [Candidatus Wirthbacteria bacterium CG2_30_54_11]
MPKLRTKSGIKKRFKVTPTGKVIHLVSGGAKLKAHKSSRTKRKYNQPAVLEGHQKAIFKKALGK